ncbi:MAG: single-stranded DNA-binding protein [Alphaproteobacteria bacterium]|nr:single-stranded DNA-binding protein [Alphaproteobacteria bacterium]
MKSLTLVGLLRADVSINGLQNGQEVATFSLATDDSYKDCHGEWQNRTDWHRIVTF